MRYSCRLMPAVLLSLVAPLFLPETRAGSVKIARLDGNEVRLSLPDYRPRDGRKPGALKLGQKEFSFNPSKAGGLESKVRFDEAALNEMLRLLSREKPAKVRICEGRAFREVELQRKCYNLAEAPAEISGDQFEAFAQENMEHISVPYSLIIKHERVVDHPEASSLGGAWSFSHIMRTLASRAGANVSDTEFPRWLDRWFSQWSTQQTVGLRTIPADAEFTQTILAPWRARSTAGTLNPKFAPLRLLAIVNRLDLRESFPLGGATGTKPFSAGRLHFVYGFVTQEGGQLEGRLIIEIGVHKEPETLREWAGKWVALKDAWPANYIGQLKALTDDVLNTSGQLASVRTNEKLGDGALWEMRQFEMGQVSNSVGEMKSMLLSQTPDKTSLAGIRRLAESHDDLINNGTYRIENDFLAAFIRPDSSYWDLPVNPRPRRILAINTCNGCHGAETKTNDHIFSHFSHRDTNSPASMSAFMSGIKSVPDPAHPADPTLQFDFDESGRRKADLALLVPAVKSHGGKVAEYLAVLGAAATGSTDGTRPKRVWGSPH